MWWSCLDRMATLYPSSGYAESLDLVEMARAWAGDLTQIPAEAVLECYRRTMNGWMGTFPPSIGDFRKSWLDPDWDYWAQLNHDEEADAALAALPPGPQPDEGPGLQTCREQFHHLKATGTFVCCLCHDEHGAYPTAIRSANGEFWVCATDRCDFREPFSAATEPEAPVEAMDGGQRLADEANLDFASCNEAQREQLSAMARWLDDSDRSVTPENFLALWEEFQSASQSQS